MNSFFIGVIIVIGASGLVAQVVLLRELLVSFLGNELTIGVMLANWLLIEALGVYLAAKLISRNKNQRGVFLALMILFSLSLPASIYYARTFKSTLAMPFGEVPGLSAIFLVSLLVFGAVACSHAGLLSASCSVYSLMARKKDSCVGEVYGWEALGTLLGSIVFTYLCIPQLNSFQTAFIIACGNLLLCIPFTVFTVSRKFRSAALVCILFALGAVLCFPPSVLQRHSLTTQWKPSQVVESRNSVYGTIAVTQSAHQQVIYYNGLPAITTPYPDTVYTQEFGHIPLLFHSYPQDILIISGAAGGLLTEILKHPVRRIDYAELDPMIFTVLDRYPTDLTSKELKDGRVKVISTDGRYFVRSTKNTYDLVLLGLSKPTDLSTNRFFTREFFSLVARRLSKGGVFAFCLPGSLAYISKEIRDLNLSILTSLKDVFTFVRVIPGEYNLILASNDQGLLAVGPGELYRRLRQRNIEHTLLVPSYLAYRLSPQWQDWFSKAMQGRAVSRNTDTLPYALFQMELLWNKQYSSALSSFLSKCAKALLPALSVSFIVIMAILLSALRAARPKAKKLSVLYTVATSGFFGMLINLIFIFSYQVNFGYLYHRLGLLIGIFTAGTAAGSLYSTRKLKEKKEHYIRLFSLEVCMLMFLCLAPLLLLGVRTWPLRYASFLYGILFFSAGLFLGAEFSIASSFFSADQQEIGSTVAIVYGADLLGGWAAGMTAGVLLLPVLGIWGSCMLLVFVKLSSSIVLFCSKGALEEPRA